VKHWIFYLMLALCLGGFLYFAMAYDIDIRAKPDKPFMMATCKDGAISYSKHRSGTCSRHGGVFKWASEEI
jgi:hypothetical protein